MNNKPLNHVDAGETTGNDDVDSVVDAIGAAMTNREAVLKSLADRREQVFKLLEEQREEALKPMLQAKKLLNQAKKSSSLAHVDRSAVNRQTVTDDATLSTADARLRLNRAVKNAFTVLSALQGAGGVAADEVREQAVTAIADALAKLVEQEVDKLLS